METILKKFVYAGAGLVAHTREHIARMVEKLVQEEKMTEQEGRKTIDEFVHSVENKRNELEKLFAQELEQMLHIEYPKSTDNNLPLKEDIG